MKSNVSKTHVNALANEGDMKLSALERTLLILPIAGGLVFGLLPFLLGGAFGTILGFPGNDSYIYRLAGAATFGYAVALVMGFSQSDWAPLRLIVIATLSFNLASIYACFAQLVAGDTNIMIYLILITSIAISVISIWLLSRHTGTTQTEPDVSIWYIRFVTLGAVLSGVFGLLPLFFPVSLAQLLGFHATDVFLIRQAGAASLGYAVMAVLGIMSGAWYELRLPLVMALIFNGFSFIASVIALFSGEPVLISLVIGAASLFVTIVGSIAYRRSGRL
jgi:hypothetical protein